jgi:hypothetical protein
MHNPPAGLRQTDLRREPLLNGRLRYSTKRKPPRWGGYATLKLYQSSMAWERRTWLSRNRHSKRSPRLAKRLADSKPMMAF